LNWIQIFNLNSNILNGIWIELNWIEFQFNYQIKLNNSIKIELKTNEMQIDEKDIQNLLVNMMLGKNKLNTNLKRHLSMSLHLRID
jgi:hypothetical protein